MSLLVCVTVIPAERKNERSSTIYKGGCMYAYIRELTAGYLVSRPNLKRLMQNIVDWEVTYGPGTIAPGRNMSKRFVYLAQVDFSALLEDAHVGQPIYLIGHQKSFIHLYLIKLEIEEYLVIDTYPDLIEFEYDRYQLASDARLLEGTALYGVQIIIPFVLLAPHQVSSLFAALKQHIPLLEREADRNAFVAQDIRVLIILNDNMIPPRTMFRISSILGKIVWELADKYRLYEIVYMLEEELKRM